jgi:hypothetical protein
MDEAVADAEALTDEISCLCHDLPFDLDFPFSFSNANVCSDATYTLEGGQLRMIPLDQGAPVDHTGASYIETDTTMGQL